MAKKTTPKKKAAPKTASKKSSKSSKEGTVDRRRSDRREKEDRRQETAEVEEDRREKPERRAKVNRRRQIDPTTCERDYNDDEIEFMHALDAYKRAAGRMFPTCSEILEVIRDLGYRRLTPEELAKFAPPQPEMAEGADLGLQTTQASPVETLENLDETLEETLDEFEG